MNGDGAFFLIRQLMKTLLFVVCYLLFKLSANLQFLALFSGVPTKQLIAFPTIYPSQLYEVQAEDMMPQDQQ